MGFNDSCVREARLGGDGGYPFRYDGLRLLQVTEGRYYLISLCQATPRVVILDPGDEMRLEFVPGTLNLVH